MKTIYLHPDKAYKHQTWHIPDFGQGALTHKIMQPLIAWLYDVTYQTKNTFPKTHETEVVGW